MSVKLSLAINGFGRIGRCFLRSAIKDKEFMEMIDVVAINDMADAKTLVHLFKYDSVFGRFDGDVKVKNEDTLSVDGLDIKVMSEIEPSKLPWKDMKVDLVLESSGKFNDAKEAEKHITVAGAKRVIISAPSKGPDTTIVLGVNENEFDNKKHNIISMASCTTNCLAPVVKVINDRFGIEKGYM
ncbi:MAG: glyceraldehyde 3-phosphate dehydrogenase NAD-binding domain-containing protein, partial [Ignavibacteriales bacterium]